MIKHINKGDKYNNDFTFENFNLNPELLKKINDCGMSIPSKDQKNAIPYILKGRNILLKSSCGIGKTTLFAITALQIIDTYLKLKNDSSSTNTIEYLQALILVSSRELAISIYNILKQLGNSLDIKIGL